MADNEQPIKPLSNRELQVLELVVTGATNKEIAQQLVISVNTVKVHMRNIFEKLGVQSRTEATLLAIQEKLVTVADEVFDSSNNEPEIVAPPAKTFLLQTDPPLILPQWQQAYLLFALLLSATVAIVPLLPQETNRLTPSLPVIYSKAPTPAPPPIQQNGTRGSWITQTAMPTSRAGLALAAFNKQIFAIGGVRNNDKATRSVEIFDTANRSWSEGAAKPTATTNIMGAVLGDKIYVPGGCTNDGTAIDTLEIYAPKTDRWLTGTPMPAARCGYGLVAHQDRLYLFGGWNGEAFEDSIFVYEAETERWQTLDESLPAPLGFMGAATLNDFIYIVGGYDGQTEHAQTYAFDPATGAWEPKSALTEPRGGLGLIAGANNLYAIGGGWEHQSETSEKYDPAADAWSPIETPFAGQWRNLGLTTVDTNLYAVGGWDGTEGAYMDSLVSYQFIFQLFLPISNLKQGN